MDDDIYFAHLKPRVGNNIFIFKEDDKYYLFAPLSRTYSVINKDMHDLLQLCNGRNLVEQILSHIEQPQNILSAILKLLDTGILVEEESVPNIDSHGDDSSIYDGFNGRFSIFPSTACNLMCKYCYANGGDNPRYICDDYYKLSMDYFFKNLPSSIENVHLSVHGGGEPTLNFPLLRNICDEFKKHSKVAAVPHKISITSNGTYEKDVRDWLITNKIGISISMDGPPEIQNYQRPFRSGNASFDVVMDNIKYLIDRGRQIGIRSTVSSFSVSTMQETVEIAKKIGIAAIHFEPVFETMRTKKAMLIPPTHEKFTRNLLSCFLKGLEYDIDVSYSGLRCIDYPHLRFCSACGYNFGLTIDGYITTCYEVLDIDDPASECFFIGKVNVRDRTVDIETEKVDYLRKRITPNLNGCKECFLRFNCAGDCVIKAYRTCNGNIYGTHEERCKLAKDINKQVIQWVADGFIEPRDSGKSQIFTYNCGGLS